MFNLKPSRVKSELEVVRTAAIAKLADHSPDSDEYKKMMKQIDILSKLIQAEKPEKLNRNTIAVILGNVGIAAMILHFERDNVLTTKLLPFLSKPKS